MRGGMKYRSGVIGDDLIIHGKDVCKILFESSNEKFLFMRKMDDIESEFIKIPINEMIGVEIKYHVIYTNDHNKESMNKLERIGYTSSQNNIFYFFSSFINENLYDLYNTKNKIERINEHS